MQDENSSTHLQSPEPGEEIPEAEADENSPEIWNAEQVGSWVLSLGCRYKYVRDLFLLYDVTGENLKDLTGVSIC